MQREIVIIPRGDTLAFLEKVLRREDPMDIEEFLNSVDVEEETSMEDADAFVKPLTLNRIEDAQLAVNEAKAGNIVLLNIADLSKRNAIKLKELITDIKSNIHAINGDIARISQDRILVTPSKVKIVKRRETK